MTKVCLIPLMLLLTSCASVNGPYPFYSYNQAQSIYPPPSYDPNFYASRLPMNINTKGKKIIYIDPNVHAWGAYAANGSLIRGGIASAGGRICPPDADSRNCKTTPGTFRISSIGGPDCYSKKYPKPHGGGLMPFCMYFNKGIALHGSPANIVVEDNVSHGCVRMMIPDAEWVVKHFAQVGTNVVVAPY